MLRSLLILAFICALSLSPCRAAPDTEAKEREAFYKWFASLKYPEAEKLPFVRLHVPVYSSDNSRRDSFLATNYAFLLKKNKNSIEIFHPNLFMKELSLDQKWGNSDNKTAYEIIPFAQGAKEWLAARNQSKTPVDIMVYRNGDNRLAGESAVMSYYFHKAGLEAYATQAYRLWEASVKAQSQPTTAIDLLAQKKLSEEENRIIEDLNNDTWEPTLPSWESLLQRSKAIVRRYGAYIGAYNETRKYIPLMERVVREEREHNQKQRKTLAQMSQVEKIKELVYQLRDQNGAQVMNPGSPNIYGRFFGGYNPDGNTPAHQLRKIGLPALPYLAETIDDDRLSRTLQRGRSWDRIWRVSQVVGDLIEGITGGERFYLDLPKNLAPAEYRRRKQAAISAWLQKVEKTCSVEGLCQRVRDGDSQAAKLLLERSKPQALLEPLKYGILHAKDSSAKEFLLQLCSKLPRAEMVPFLTERAEQEKSLDVRVAAIRTLGEFEKARALKYMLKECRQSRQEANESMVSYLIDSGEAEALKAVERHLSAFNPFSLTSLLSDITSVSCENSERHERSSQKIAYRKVAEEILVKFLNDITRDNSGGSYGDYTFSNARTCDLVAIYLNTLDKKKYPIRYPLPVKELDEQRYRLINIWRKENGQPLLAEGQ